MKYHSVKKEDLCVSCRNLYFGSTGRTLGDMIDLYYSGNEEFDKFVARQGGSSSFFSAIHYALHGGIDSCCASARCARLVRTGSG